MKFLNRVHLHPYLIGIFPVLSLYAHNQSQLEPNAPWRSMVVILGGTTLVFIGSRLWLKDWGKAAFITSYASLVFFLYNPVREELHDIHSANFNLGWNRYFFFVWLLVLIVGVWMIVKELPATGNTIRLFNLVALATVLLPFISVVSYSISHHPVNAAKSSSSLVKQNIASVKKRPDVYYIILDMYGRSDTIEEEFGYDNSPFLKELRGQGFYVASCSTSNYSHTVMSIASTLNMNFLPALGNDFVAGNTDYFDAAALIKNSAVRRYLQAYGYSFVSFETGFPYVNIPDADVYIRMPKRKGQIQAFEWLLIGQTPLKIITDKIDTSTSELESMRQYGGNYDLTLFTLERLSQLPKAVSGPKFVYAHLIIPHPPYIFGPNGEYVGDEHRLNGGPYGNPVDDAAYHQGYTDQLRYIDSVMPTILTQLISQSKIPPIIIVQGDHGFWGDPYKRLPILNAYYLPGKDASQLLYPGITPVNSFRVVLNAYFNGQFKLLPDEKYPTMDPKDYYNVQRMDADSIGCKPK